MIGPSTPTRAVTTTLSPPLYADLASSTTRATPKSKRRRKVPPPGRIPLLEETALLSWFEAHNVKPQHYYTLLRVLVSHPDPTSMTWDEVPWESKALGLPPKLRELLPKVGVGWVGGGKRGGPATEAIAGGGGLPTTGRVFVRARVVRELRGEPRSVGLQS